MRRRHGTVHDARMNILRTLSPLVLLTVVGVWLGGCSAPVEKAGIAVSLVDLTVGPDNKAVLVLRMQNENVTPIAISSTKHKVVRNGESFGQAVGEKPVALKEHGDVRHEAALPLANAAAAARLRAMLAAGGVDYRLDSRLLCEAGDEDVILVTTAHGRLDRR